MIKPLELLTALASLAIVTVRVPVKESTSPPYVAVTLMSRGGIGKRTAWVSLPRHYALTTRRYPLTIVLDGQERRLLDLAHALPHAPI